MKYISFKYITFLQLILSLIKYLDTLTGLEHVITLETSAS